MQSNSTSLISIEFTNQTSPRDPPEASLCNRILCVYYHTLHFYVVTTLSSQVLRLVRRALYLPVSLLQKQLFKSTDHFCNQLSELNNSCVNSQMEMLLSFQGIYLLITSFHLQLAFKFGIIPLGYFLLSCLLKSSQTQILTSFSCLLTVADSCKGY